VASRSPRAAALAGRAGQVYRAARRRPVLTAAIAAGAGVLVAGGVLAGVLGSAPSPAGGSGARRPAAGSLSGRAVRAQVVAALRSARGDIVAVRAPGAYYPRTWVWPAVPGAGRLEHDVSARMKPGTAKLTSVVETAYRTPAAGNPASACRWLSIDYASRTYERLNSTKCATAAPGAWAEQLIRDAAAGEFTVVGRATLGGQPAIELQVAGAAGRIPLWVSARSLLPVASRAPVAGDGPVGRQTFEFLAPGPASLQTVPASIPAGFREGS